MNGLKETLMAQARGKGICLGGYSEMRGRDLDGLADYYIANPDWCMERDFPDLATLAEVAPAYEGRGIFVGREFDGELLDERQTYIFHNCRGTIRVGLNTALGLIPMLYFGNGCRMRVEGVGDSSGGEWRTPPARVPIYVFGDNEVLADDNEAVEFARYDSGIIEARVG